MSCLVFRYNSPTIYNAEIAYWMRILFLTGKYISQVAQKGQEHTNRNVQVD
jgi:hypothetical protein